MAKEVKNLNNLWEPVFETSSLLLFRTLLYNHLETDRRVIEDKLKNLASCSQPMRWKRKAHRDFPALSSASYIRLY